MSGPTECMFYGLGSDGTVGANKGAVKMMAMMGAALHMQVNGLACQVNSCNCARMLLLAVWIRLPHASERICMPLVASSHFRINFLVPGLL